MQKYEILKLKDKYKNIWTSTFISIPDSNCAM